MKTASELGLSEAELVALVRVQERLARGEIPMHQNEHTKGNAFDMYEDYRENSCGSVGCIAGWMAWDLAGGEQAKADEVLSRTRKLFTRDGMLQQLFFPTKAQKDWGKITPGEAVEAIGNFLITGDPKWDYVTQEEERM